MFLESSVAIQHFGANDAGLGMFFCKINQVLQAGFVNNRIGIEQQNIFLGFGQADGLIVGLGEA